MNVWSLWHSISRAVWHKKLLKLPFSPISPFPKAGQRDWMHRNEGLRSLESKNVQWERQSFTLSTEPKYSTENLSNPSVAPSHTFCTFLVVKCCYLNNLYNFTKWNVTPGKTYEVPEYFSVPLPLEGGIQPPFLYHSVHFCTRPVFAKLETLGRPATPLRRWTPTSTHLDQVFTTKFGRQKLTNQ